MTAKLGLILLLFLSGCATSKVKESKQNNLNPFQKMCACQNANGISIEEYAQKEQKKLKMSDVEYSRHLKKIIWNKKTDNWLQKEFMSDEKYFSTRIQCEYSYSKW